MADDFEKVRDLKEQHLQLQKEHLQLEKKYANARKECGELKKQLAAAYGDNDELRVTKDDEIEDISKRLSDSEKQAEKLQVSLNKARDSLEKSQKQINEKKCCNLS